MCVRVGVPEQEGGHFRGTVTPLLRGRASSSWAVGMGSQGSGPHASLKPRSQKQMSINPAQNCKFILSLAYFTVRIYSIIHTTDKIC